MKLHQLITNTEVFENFGIFKNNQKQKDAEIERLQRMAKLGNKHAQAKLDRLQGKSDDKEASWQRAKAEVEAGERGSSRAFDKETGSVNPKSRFKWDPETKTWQR